LRRHRRDKLSKLLGQLSDDELTAFLTGLRAMRRARAALGAESDTGENAAAEDDSLLGDPEDGDPDEGDSSSSEPGS
jgi:hypothetical protein